MRSEYVIMVMNSINTDFIIFNNWFIFHELCRFGNKNNYYHL